jgi:two-component sensor histidine kinase
VLGVLLDISERKAAEQRQQLLFDELNHRVKNTLAIVQSLAQQTLRNHPDPGAFSRAFGDRVASLARAHDLLTQDSWRGATLTDVVTAALGPFADREHAIDISGDAVMVPANVTITLSLLLHELATNAAKYGALSVPAGRLAVTWQARESGTVVNIDMHWVEDGGPPVTPPAKQGFGSRFLQASALQLNAKFDCDYAPAGVRCRLRFAVPLMARDLT